MKFEALKKFEGKQVSVVTRVAPRPTGGILEVVGEDYIILNPKSIKTDRFIISITDIISVLVLKNQSMEKINDEFR